MRRFLMIFILLTSDNVEHLAAPHRQEPFCSTGSTLSGIFAPLVRVPQEGRPFENMAKTDKSIHLNYTEKRRPDWKTFFTLRFVCQNCENWCSFSLKKKRCFLMNFKPNAGAHISCVFLGLERLSGKCVNLSEKQRCNSTSIGAHEGSSLSLRFKAFPCMRDSAPPMGTMTRC